MTRYILIIIFPSEIESTRPYPKGGGFRGWKPSRNFCIKLIITKYILDEIDTYLNVTFKEYFYFIFFKTLSEIISQVRHWVYT